MLTSVPFETVLLPALLATLVLAALATPADGAANTPVHPIAVIHTTLGDLRCELFSDRAPKAAGNFIGLATGKKPWTDPRTHKIQHNRPFYDGVIFHRVIPGFVIQGGDPLGTGTGGPGYHFEDELHADLLFDRPGRLAMANAGPNTNGGQFFITLAPTDWLTGKHTVFGEVVDGMDVIKKIGNTKTTKPGDKPVTPITVKSVTIERK